MATSKRTKPASEKPKSTKPLTNGKAASDSDIHVNEIGLSQAKTDKHDKAASTHQGTTLGEQMLDSDALNVFGARVHNLKNVDVSIPRNRLVVLTGISGSGKSSLAFDTIYAEGQRRYMESFSAYARQFIGSMERPDVDNITGLSPVISIEQKSTSKNPRSTVGTITEIYDFLRLLFARAGDAYSYVSGKAMVRYAPEQILESIREHYDGEKIVLLAPLVKGRKGHYRELFEEVRKKGFLKVRVDGEMMDLVPKMQVDRYKVHDIEVVIDRVEMGTNSEDRLKRSLDLSLKTGNGLVMVIKHDEVTPRYYSQHLMDPETGLAYEDPSPNTFSFNSPYGACPNCKGLGFVYEINKKDIIPDWDKSINDGGLVPLGEVRDNFTFDQVRAIARKYKFTLATPLKDIPSAAMDVLLYGSEGEKYSLSLAYDSFASDTASQPERSYNAGFEGVVNLISRLFRDTTSDTLRKWAEEFMTTAECPDCKGARLKPESLAYKVAGKNIAELSNMDVDTLLKWFENVEAKMSEKQKTIARDVLKEIRVRLQFLLDVGLNYLSLNRPSRSMSGGEAQRIRLATQIGSQLSGITYILDEPSIGLHQRDNHRLIGALRSLADGGNTVLVVEHDKDIMLAADYVFDLGPGAGEHGGKVVAHGTPEEFMHQGSLTADYLSGAKEVPIPPSRREGNGKKMRLKKATGHNLKNVTVEFPLGKLIVITGVSGSGKSSLINETLYPLLRNFYYDTRTQPLSNGGLEGMSYCDKVIEIDQAPIGRTPRSNPATYIGVFTDIRDWFTQLPESKIRGYKPGRFSFNVKGGRCEECQGAGMKTIEMNFLPDVYVQCEKCLGKRYNRETLEIRYKGKSIADVLDMTIEDACRFFESNPNILRKIATMDNVGLGYIRLGQQATTLSGGEAQRVKLASELSKRDTGRTFYILDEPTTGLHFEDIRVLMEVLNRLVDHGNTVLVIEHNMDVIKQADHVIDLGPEGGAAGGQILFEGTPEDLCRVKESHTGKYLKMEMEWQQSKQLV